MENMTGRSEHRVWDKMENTKLWGIDQTLLFFFGLIVVYKLGETSMEMPLYQISFNGVFFPDPKKNPKTIWMRI